MSQPQADGVYDVRDGVHDDVYDVIGIGFGPANLALAIALEEAAADAQLERLFLEAKPSYVWHPGMLIEDSLLQITAIKDLITVENPRSRFTFLNYLKEKGRLYEFLNLRDLFPTRIEFNDYLGWAAELLDRRVRYGSEVRRVVPVSAEGREINGDGPVDLLRIDLADEDAPSFTTRNLVVATGGTPKLPPGIEIGDDAPAFHSHHFLHQLERFPDRDAPYRFIVVGSGQSAAEIFLHLLDHYPNAEVTATIRRFAYKPVDESDFTNRIFFPKWTDYYNRLPPHKRRAFFEDLKDVNYAVIDHALIRRIYQRLYRQKVAGRQRGRIRPFLHLESLVERPDGRAEARYRNTMEEKAVVLQADAVVMCTGYTWHKEHPLLAQLAPWFGRDDLGGYQVERDYGIACRSEFAPRVYLQGYCEDTHGIGETVLSLLPVRAADIFRSLRAVCNRQEAAASPAPVTVPTAT